MPIEFPRKIKIVYDRQGCIGAAACAAINPIDWIIDKDDGKANLTESSKENGKFTKIMEVKDEDSMQRIIESAKVCPVSVIEIWDLKENIKLAPP